MDLIPHNYYEAESVSFITRRNIDDVGWFGTIELILYKTKQLEL